MTRLAEEEPGGTGWLHEIKYDGYPMHARIDSDTIQLTHQNLFSATDWTDEEKRIAVAQILRHAGMPDDNCLTHPAAAKMNSARSLESR